MAVAVDSIDYQIKLLALMIIHPTLLQDYRPSIRAEWWESKDLRTLATGVLKYYDRYFQPPAFSDLSGFLSLQDDSTPARILTGLEKFSQDDLEFVYDQFKEFVSVSAYKSATLAAAQALEEGKYEIIPGLFREASTLSAQSYKPVVFFDAVKDLLKNPTPRRSIPTGVTGIDLIMEGGPARQEVTVIAGYTNVGKSTVAINTASHAITKGYKVLHLTAEDGEELVARRYAQRLVKRTRDDIFRLPNKANNKLQAIRQKSGGELEIIFVGGWSVQDMRTCLYRMEVPPDVIVLDYPDKLKPHMRYKDRWLEIETIYNELVLIAREWDLVLYTISQLNREGGSKRNPGMGDMDRSIDKAKIAHNVLVIAQTKPERERGDMRIRLDKLKDLDGAGREVTVKVLFDRSMIIDMDDFNLE